MDFMKGVQYKIFMKCRIPELGGQLKSEQYDSKTGIGWSVILVFTPNISFQFNPDAVVFVNFKLIFIILNGHQ